MPTKTRDLGFTAVLVAVAQLKRNPHVRVGVNEAEGSKEYEDGTTILEVALANEYGVPGRIPARPAFRIAGIKLEPIIASLSAQILDQIARGRMTVSKGLDILGMRAKTEIQDTIGSNLPPPNAPATIARKGSDKTLIDSGQYRASIDYVKVGV
jgi:hypothetical protein